MATMATISYNMGLEAIVRAYRASQATFKAQHDAAGRRFAEYEAKATPEEVLDSDFGELMGEEIYEAEASIRLVREAFAMTLYHFWEKQAAEVLGLTSHLFRDLKAAAAADPRFGIDVPGLNRLRLIANCVKHAGGSELFSLDPTLFDPALIPKTATSRNGWHDALRLRDQDVESAILAVRASGPRSAPSTDLVEEVTL